MAAMPTPSQHTRLSLEGRLDEHARTVWPQLKRLNIRHRGAFAYVEVELAGGERGKLMRLRYTGTVARVGLRPLPGQPRPLRGRHPAERVLPEEALDCSCGLSLATPGHLGHVP